ncbi:MAG: hypothetical protein HUJ77_10575 [Clostridium sp.]|uniref:hypothetical protein n=1 Tax=Clostridium sp. TaxID=1506 RepID=UPI0025C2E7D1|nr:hypothetical protein [Clostridium sp.]MCF0148825.1 hypothetical protein [Clostridium sp.]
MRSYKEYINNLEDYKDIDLLNLRGIIKINLGNDSFITYGNLIVAAFTRILIQLENRKGTNKNLQKAYDAIGDAGINIDILEVGEKINLREKSKEYIEKLQPTLNYQRNVMGFSEEHKKHLSECKKGEKHNRVKLTEEEAKEIKYLATSTGMTSVEIGEIFNISDSQVRKIKVGIAWSHIKV